MVKVRVKVV
ncbi:unnamed protein product [Knipowitschia caucasica]